MKINMTLTATMLSVMLGTSLHAATWYADASMPDDSGDGTSAATAKKYIQSAVSLANADEDAEVTVLVAPGDYSEGAAVQDSNNALNRVRITKKMTLESTHGKAVTFIVGALGSGDYGLGAGSIRAVCVDGAAAAGTRIQGFTFRDSAAGAANSDPKGAGGAVCFNQGTCDVYVLDCTATNCAAYYGGGMRGVVAIRSLITHCHNDNRGNRGSALSASKAYNCIFAHCGSSSDEYVLHGSDGPYINCTAVANNGSLLRNSASQKIYNLLSTLCSRQEFDGTNKGGPNCIQEYSNGKDSKSEQLASSLTSRYTTLLVSPLAGDYRPVVNANGGRAEGFGSTTWLSDENLSFVPEGERGTDYFGKPRIVDGKVDVGAIQGAVAISGGRIVVPQIVPPSTTTGSYTRYMYANAEVWPAQIRITQPEDTFCSVVTNISAFRFADSHGGFWQTLPQSGSAIITNIAATAKLFVDAAAAAGGDGTSAAPYQTIQDAVDAASADGYTVITVASGIYETGGGVSSDSQAARVLVDGSKNLLIRSASGKAEDVEIRGAYHAEGSKCGANAVRCVTVSEGIGIIGIRGVTICGGASGVGEGTGYANAGNHAGGLYVVGDSDLTRVQVMDSVFTGNYGRNGSAAWGGWLQRCLLYENENPEDTKGVATIAKARMSSCILYENRRRGDQMVANGTTAYNCTINGTCGSTAQELAAVSSKICGCAILGGMFSRKPAEISENIVWNLSSITNAITSGITEADPKFANVTFRNYSPLAGSPLFGAVTPENVTDFWKYVVDDFYGNPINVSAEGKVTAGAVQNAYTPMSAYVDAANGNDANDGLTAETAKRTLAAALALASAPGDTVIAAAGTYDDGTALHPTAFCGSDAPTIPSRGFVWPGVTLVGAGATNTVVRGGVEVRCLAVGAGASVSGFAFVDGQVKTTYSSRKDNSVGGGILAADDPSTTITDCVFTNNAASHGGAAHGGTYNRCVFVDNKSHYEADSLTGAATVMAATLRNCLFTGNKAQKIADDYDGVYNCTFLYDNMRMNGTSRLLLFGTYRDTAPVVNSAFLISPTDNNVETLSASIYAATNCFFPQIGTDTWRWSLPAERCSGNITNDYTVAYGDAGLTDATVWASRRRKVTVDAGATAYVAEGDLDLAGNPRVSNGIVDIGCYEWQWQPPTGTVLIIR